MYGYDTHSWRNSTEKRQLDRERKDTTARYVVGEIKFAPVSLPLRCRCLSFQFAHDITQHRRLRGEWDWRPWWDDRHGQHETRLLGYDAE